MAKIAIIIHYSGKLPGYFNLFAHSCHFNKEIDFLVVTDADAAADLPQNIRFCKMTLPEFRARVEAIFSIEASVNSGYKLCDFRPFYGLLFQDYLQGYDFWGHCDIDLVLANVLEYLPPEALHCDIVSVRKEWISGSFALYRNNDMVNNLFRESKDWQKVLQDNYYYRFDECGTMKAGEAMAYSLILSGKPILELDSEVESISHLVEKIKQKKLNLPLNIYQQTCIKESISPNMLLKYDKGSIAIAESTHPSYPVGMKFLHYHYITEKKNRYFSFPNWKEIPDIFYIDETGFYNVADIERRSTIKRKRKLNGNLKYYFSTLPKKIYKKIFKK